jgi:hypothetical protein
MDRIWVLPCMFYHECKVRNEAWIRHCCSACMQLISSVLLDHAYDCVADGRMKADAAGTTHARTASWPVHVDACNAACSWLEGSIMHACNVTSSYTYLEMVEWRDVDLIQLARDGQAGHAHQFNHPRLPTLHAMDRQTTWYCIHQLLQSFSFIFVFLDICHRTEIYRFNWIIKNTVRSYTNWTHQVAVDGEESVQIVDCIEHRRHRQSQPTKCLPIHSENNARKHAYICSYYIYPQPCMHIKVN